MIPFFLSTFAREIRKLMEDFIHLHVHTHYSILDGQSKVANLVKKAVGDGMRGMAITDHGVMYGVKELADCCAKVNKAVSYTHLTLPTKA